MIARLADALPLSASDSGSAPASTCKSGIFSKLTSRTSINQKPFKAIAIMVVPFWQSRSKDETKSKSCYVILFECYITFGLAQKKVLSHRHNPAITFW